MTFEDLWEAVAELKILPNTAIDQIPGILNEQTKNRLLELDTQTVARLIDEAIEEINHGSIESINTLIAKRMI